MDCPICGSGYGHKDGCPEKEPIREKSGICDICDEFIYEGDKVIEFDGVLYHKECFCEEYEREA